MTVCPLQCNCWAWNETFPIWSYSDQKKFYKDSHRAYERVTGRKLIRQSPGWWVET